MSDYNPYQQPQAEVTSVARAELSVHEPGKCTLGDGSRWVADGWRLFTSRPWFWMGIVLINQLIVGAIAMVPFGIGDVLQMLISPVFLAGMLFVASKMDKGESTSIADMFEGFREKPMRLVLMGIVFGVAILLIMLLVIAIFWLGATLIGVDVGAQAMNIQNANTAQQGLLIALFICFYLLFAVPLMAAYWFGVPLVFFTDRGIFEALGLSIKAAIRNFWPLVWYGIVFLLLMIGLMVPLGLIAGVGFLVGSGLEWVTGIFSGLTFVLVILSLINTSWYASFRDIFLKPE